jgi:hypothetical protein
MKPGVNSLLLLWVLLFVPVAAFARTSGPLRVSPTNPRYFVDGTGRTVLLGGSHTWGSVFNQGPSDPPPDFNITRFLDFLQNYGHNFTRTFVWEQSRWGTWTTDNNYWFYPGPPWKRTGPGTADDGKPRFNLDSLNQVYFDWVKARVDSFDTRGIYCSVQLFDGWSVKARTGVGNPWNGHPFKSSNNVNSVNGDPNGDGSGEETQSYNSVYWKYQEAYIKKLIDELNTFDNIIWEVSNESSYGGSDLWEKRIIDTVHAYELRKPKQHPVGFTGDWYAPILNPVLFGSRADWISPGGGNNGEIWKTDPPDSGGRKVVLNDTDHLWGNGGDLTWVWKSFCRGCNVLYMDGYDGKAYGTGHPWTQADSASTTVVLLRKNIGYVLAYSRRVDLAALSPKTALSSTGYCLANPDPVGAAYIVFNPSSGTGFTVDLSGAGGSLVVEWCNPSTGEKLDGGTVGGGTTRSFTAPFAGESVVFIHHPGIGAVEVESGMPAPFDLFPNFPNPFNPATSIRYALPERGFVRLEVVDLEGRRTRLLLAREQEAGVYVTRWDGTSDAGTPLSSGIYFCRLSSEGRTLVRKMLLLR